MARAVVTAELCVLDTTGRPVEIEKLLYFEPYAHLGEAILHELFNEQSPNYEKEVTDEFLYRIADHVYEKKDMFHKLF